MKKKSAVYVTPLHSSSLDTEGQNLNLNLQWSLTVATICRFMYIVLYYHVALYQVGSTAYNIVWSQLLHEPK